jgi:formate-dependent nitrite reductase membrane component NrfD
LHPVFVSSILTKAGSELPKNLMRRINKMDKKTKGLIATIAAVVLCGCPGLFMCIFGAFTATGNMPYNTEVNGVQSSGMMPASVGYVMLCLSLIGILVPILVGFFMLRKKPEVVQHNEPLPPAS